MRYSHVFLIVLVSLLVLIVLSRPTSNVASISQKEGLVIEPLKSLHDQDGDGIDDFTDIMLSARAQIGVVTKYDTNYYSDAYPPDNMGACADVIWRALQQSGYDFKSLIDEDMSNSPTDYKNDPIPDRNINFRRVQNIRIFLSKYALSLPVEVVPYDKENVTQWQGGDIVTFDQIPGGLWHTAIVSDKRREDGVPFLIHNYGVGVKESDYLLSWPTEITGHFRFDGEKLMKLLNNS